MSNQEFEEFLKQVNAAAREAARTEPQRESLEETPGEILRFGNYEIVRELGSGGFGVVFLSRDIRSDALVALKLPMPHVLISRSARARFQREGRVGAVLEHPGIVKVLESGEAGRIFYIASEYVPGPNLSEWIQERTAPVPVRVATAIVARLAEAVAHAHAQGVIHRDLKPANVILRPVGGSGAGRLEDELAFQPCVTDFGLAKVLHELREEITSSSDEIGSAAYMAPEQAQGQNDRIGPWTDIHALGAILYRLIAGRPPFVGDTRREVLNKIARDIPPKLRTFRPDVPKELEWICDQCMRKNPAERYADSGILAADLERFLAGERIQARPVPSLKRGMNWARRHPGVSSAALVSLVFMSGTIVSQRLDNRKLAGLIDLLKQKNQELSESQQRESEQRLLAEARLAMTHRAYQGTRLQTAGNLVNAGRVERAQQVLMEIDAGPGRRDFAWGHLMLRASEQMDVLAFENDIRVMDVSPDGRLVASLGDEGQVSVREISTGRELQRFGIRGNMGREIRFSRDGRKIYALMRQIEFGERDQSVTSVLSVREGETTREIAFASGPKSFVESASGDRLRFVEHDPAAGKWRIRAILLADLSMAEEVGTESAAPISLLADGRWAVLVDGAGMLRLKAMEGQAGDRYMARWSDLIKDSVSVHPTRARVAWLERNGQRVFLKTFDAESGRAAEHPIEISATRCSWIEGSEQLLIYDGTWNPVVLNMRDGQVRSLRASDASKRPKLDETRSEVRAISRGDRLLTYAYFLEPGGHSDQLWDLVSGDEMKFDPEGAIARASLPDDSGSLLLMNANALMRWWPEGRDRATRKLAGHMDEAWGACFSPDGTVLVTSGNDTSDRLTVRVWDWKSGELIRGFAPHKATVSAVEFSPDGRYLATCALAREDNLSLWDPKTGKRIVDLAGHGSSVYAMAFSEDGTRLASGDRDGNVIVWDVDGGEAVVRFRADIDKIRDLSFARGSRTIVATASESRRARIWETSEQRLLREWVSSSEITALAFVPGKPWLCVAEESGALVLRNTETGDRVRQMDGEGGRIGDIRFLSDSGILATGDSKGLLRLWDVNTGIELMNLKGHAASINRLACTANAATLATVAHDGSVRLWFSE